MVQIREHTKTRLSEFSDGVLAQKSLVNDQRAFEALVQRYRPTLFNFICHILGDYDQSCDILQQVFLQLYISLPTLNTGKSLRGWLFQVARNRCLDELRRRRRRAEIPFSTLERECRGEEQSPVEAIPDSDLSPEEIAGLRARAVI